MYYGMLYCAFENKTVLPFRDLTDIVQFNNCVWLLLSHNELVKINQSYIKKFRSYALTY